MSEVPDRMGAGDPETVAFSASDTPGSGTFAPGSLIASRYRIDALLAEGGMGRVYRAHDLHLDVRLAVKTIHPRIASNTASLHRFKQEVLLARSVTHPNVCRIFDLQRDDASGLSFLTMEFLDGETLSSRIRSRGALSAEESLPLIRQIADALDAAHRAGIVHRDFKSPNVMLVPDGNGGRAVITDFGLAVTVDSRDTESPAIVGTPAYMSPEQARGESVGPASDLYAFGIVLYEMCTGTLPFQGPTPREMLRAHLTTEPPSPRTLSEITDSWERTILRLLAKEPAHRFGTAREAVAALEEDRPADGSKPPHALPAEHDAFVGRTAELRTIAAHLDSKNADATRLLTLLGPGGTGKTRLVLKYGWDALPVWPGGIWFCDLSEARSIDGITAAVAKALGVALGKGDPITQLGHAIAARGRCLLILDNFEQVVEHAEATLGRWMDRATDTYFLTTSRERLQLPRETLYELTPLDPESQAVELFEIRARSHRPGFSVDPANRKQVTSIVKRLDGLPLAIELAAARMRILSLDQLEARLHDRFKILSGGKKGRQSTLRRTLDWSWDLLRPWEQSAVAQASVFEGGFTLEAAETVIDLDGHPDAPWVIDVIQSLVDKSWLRARVIRGEPRFSMYATVQEYADQKLRSRTADEPSEASIGPRSRQVAEARHGAFFAGVGSEESLEKLDRHGGTALRSALGLELDNLVMSCRRAIARRDETTAVATYRAADAVLGFRGPFSVSVQLGHDVLAVLEDATLRAPRLLTLARAEWRVGRMESARTHAEEAMALYETEGDRQGTGNALFTLGLLDSQQGQFEAARERYETALAIQREVGNRSGEGSVLGDLANVCVKLGRLDQAPGHYEAALAIHREFGDRRSEGTVLSNLAIFHMHQGRVEESRRLNDESLAIVREVGDRRVEGGVLGNLGVLLTELGQLQDAREHYEMALTIHRETGNRNGEGSVLGNLGNTCVRLGRFDDAQDHFEKALSIHRETGNRQFEGSVLSNLGSLFFERKELPEARKHYEAALIIDREVGDRRTEGLALGNLGNLDFEEGRLDDAREHYEAALAIHHEMGSLRYEGVFLGRLGRLMGKQGRLEEARARYEEGEALLRAVEATRDVALLLCNRAETELRSGALDEALAVFRRAEAEAVEVAAETELGRKLSELREALDDRP